MVLVSFWRYPDPYPLKRIGIRIRPNDKDPDPELKNCLSHMILKFMLDYLHPLGGVEPSAAGGKDEEAAGD